MYNWGIKQKVKQTKKPLEKSYFIRIQKIPPYTFDLII